MILDLPIHKNEIALAVFILTYMGIAAGHVRGTGLGRTGICLIGAIAMLTFGVLTMDQAVDTVHYPAILMLFGLFIVSAQLRLAGFYRWVAEFIARFLDHPKRFLLLLMLSSGGLSAFLNNDIVCAAFTPVVAVALLKKRINPIPFLVALAISSNIGCAATFIGNAQNILVGQVAHLRFGGYMAFALPPVLASLLAGWLIIWGLCRNHLALAGTPLPPGTGENPQPIQRGQVVKGLGVLSLLIILYFTSLPRDIVTLAAAAILLTSSRLTSKAILALVDWEVILLFISLFVIVGAFQQSGYGGEAVRWLIQHGVHLQNPIELALMTGVLSNLINNSAAVMLLVNLVDFTNPVLGYVLALSNALCGNLLIIGSVASIIVVKMARDTGVEISFWAFARYGIPVTAASFLILCGWTLMA